MTTFFHGWRRKVGCVALVMACGLMGLWMRSETIADSVLLGQFGLSSQYGHVSWEWLDSSDAAIKSKLIRGRSWEKGYFPYENEFQYWHLVLPLASLSAYLILWKPRKKKSGPTT